jgi:hypothetical protein
MTLVLGGVDRNRRVSDAHREQRLREYSETVARQLQADGLL